MMEECKKYFMTTRQFNAPSNSAACVLNRGFCREPYKSLANAIVACAADDYRLALREGLTPLREDLEGFFRSEYCAILTGLDTEVLIEDIRREYPGWEGECR